ncbi:unnamed protein product [Protopolystoma xenopodis]|uniref:Uncharacterized protein n=1 Tax=Protopolystoma xenopodis TaxID=117903 RepID=A0A448WPS2_9PLAT|nr:unnamed protein product [Protopolystoma xenopodis]
MASIGYRGHTAWLTSCAWAPHRPEQFITGSVDRTVRLWDQRNLQVSLYDLIGHSDMVTAVDWASPVIALARAQPHQADHDIEVSTPQVKHYILSASADGSAKIYHYQA